VADDPDDMDIAVWAGVQPLGIVAGEPEPDEGLAPGVQLPPYLRPYHR
jgi:uncharacterized protein